VAASWQGVCQARLAYGSHLLGVLVALLVWVLVILGAAVWHQIQMPCMHTQQQQQQRQQ
jgi:cytochrome c-type biogenesis protein CcmH/NrfG